MARVPPVKLHKQQHEGVMAQNQYKSVAMIGECCCNKELEFALRCKAQ